MKDDTAKKIEEKDITQVVDVLLESHNKVDARQHPLTSALFGHITSALRNFGFDEKAPANFTAVAKYKFALLNGRAKKGLCLMGRPGTGKTLAMKFINGGGYRAQSLVRLYTDNPELFEDRCYGIPEYNVQVPILTIDDLGAEPTLNYYGTKVEVMDDVVSRRAVLFCDCGHLLNLTTNLQPEELDERYGPRLFSRIREMCNVVIFQGPDRRKTGNEEFMR